MRIACYQPDIPQNMGAIIRIAACFAADVAVIEPCGFVFSDRKMRRAGMDYQPLRPLERFADWETFQRATPTRVILLSTKAQTSLWDWQFEETDTVLLGRESAGVPDEVFAQTDAQLRIPISNAARSLNIASACAIAIAHAQNQCGFNPQKTEE